MPYGAAASAALEAGPYWIPATVLLREIRKRGTIWEHESTQGLAGSLGSERVRGDGWFRGFARQGETRVDFTEVRQHRHRLLVFAATMG